MELYKKKCNQEVDLLMNILAASSILLKTQQKNTVNYVKVALKH